MLPVRHVSRRAIAGWVLFDWAAQPFFTLIITFVYAPYFASAIASDPVQGQALWGFATAAAGFTVAALSPVLGSIADASGRRKPWIAPNRQRPARRTPRSTACAAPTHPRSIRARAKAPRP